MVCVVRCRCKAADSVRKTSEKLRADDLFNAMIAIGSFE